MTKITYVLTEDKIMEVKITGHANYDTKGYDIVCASISTLALYSLNLMESFNELANISYEVKDAYVNIKVLNSTKVIQTILTTMLKELEELYNQFPKNIKINCRRLAQ